MALNFKIKSKILDELDRIIPPEEQGAFIERERKLLPTREDLKKVGKFVGKQLSFGQARGALLRGRPGQPSEVIKPTEAKALGKTVAFPFRQIHRPIAGIQETVGTALEGKTAAEALRAGARGFLEPEKAKTITSRVPITKFERGGPAARLIPRALVTGVEEFALFQLVFGNAAKRVAQGIRGRVSLDRVKRAIPALEKLKVKFGSSKTIGRGDVLTQKAKAFITEAQRNPAMRKVLDAISKGQLVKGQPTLLFAGAPVPFKPGDIVRIGKDIAKISKIEAGKAILLIGGKEVVKNLSDLSPEPLAEEAKKFETAEEFTKAQKANVYSSEDIELHPEIAKNIVGPAFLQGDKIIGAKFGEGGIYNHADIAKKLDFPKDIVPGFIDKEGKFLYQYEEDIPKQQLTDIFNKAKEVTPVDPKSIIEQAGGKFKGITPGLKAQGEFPATPDIIQFDDPKTGSTLAVAGDKFSLEAVKAKIAKSRESFVEGGKLKTPAKPIIRQPKSIRSIIRKAGGIDPTSLQAAGVSKQDIAEFGAKGLLKKGGQKFEDLANQLIESGDIILSGDEFPSVALLDSIQSDATSLSFADEVSPGVERAIKPPAVIKPKAPIIKPSVLSLGKVKPTIHEATGFTKTIETIVTNEAKLLKFKLQAEQRASKLGEKVGKREVRTAEALKRKVNDLVKTINSLSKRDIPPDFKDQVDAIMSKFDLHFRAPKTIARRQSMRDFVERLKAEGELIPIPTDRLEAIDQITLNNLNVDQLEAIKDTIAQIVHIGALKKKLIASKQLRDFKVVENDIVTRIRELRPNKVVEELGEEFAPPSARKKDFFGRIDDAVSKFFGFHRKTEFIARTLDGFGSGPVQDNITQPIQDAGSAELSKTEEVYTKLRNLVQPLNMNKVINTKISVPGVKTQMTIEEMMTVYLNSQNSGNLERLIRGNNLTEAQIDTINSKLAKDYPEVKTFADGIFDLFDSLFDDTVNTTLKLTGLRVQKVAGRYFPIITDKELSKMAQFREAEKDLFQEVFQRTSVEKGFTKSRVGGRDAIELRGFTSIMRHLDSVIHYNTHALAIRDVQKLIASPRIKNAIDNAMGEAITKQFPPWLKTVADPRTPGVTTVEKWVDHLRRNSTAAILGLKFSVSLLQAGSFTLTIKEIGLVPSMQGLVEFWRNPNAATRFVFENSSQMKFRAKTFDREIKDRINSRGVQKMIKDLPGADEVLFAMIKGVDFLTTMPSWLGAYHLKLGQTNSHIEAVRYADKIVRLTQPQGSVKDLAQISRGRPFQKLFTAFYTFFSQLYNQQASTFDRLKFGKEHPLRKVRDFTSAWFWILVAPVIYSTMARSGFNVFDKKKFTKNFVKKFPAEAISYAFGGLFLIRDLASAIAKPFGFKAPPGLRGFESGARGARAKSTKSKIKNFTRALGTFTGRIPDQLFTTFDGIMDLASGRSKDIRRLVFSKYALGEKKEKKPKSKFQGRSRLRRKTLRRNKLSFR